MASKRKTAAGAPSPTAAVETVKDSLGVVDPRTLQERLQLARPRRMPQLAERLGLDLTDALSGDRERLADLFQGVLGPVAQAEAHLDDLLLARSQGLQESLGLLLQVDVDHGLRRRDHVAVLDEVAEMRILFLADRSLQRDRLLRDLQDLSHLRDRDVHPLRDLLRRRLAAQLLDQRARRADELVDRLDHVHGNTDGARLVGDGAGDGLADPPRRVGRELVAALVLELVDRLHQPDVAFLDQVQELQAAVRVLLRDGDDQAEVGFHQLLLGRFRADLALDHGPQLALELVRGRVEVLGDRAQAFPLVADRLAQDLAVLFRLRGLDLDLDLVDGALGLADALDGLAQALDQAALHRLRELDALDRQRHADAQAGQLPLRADVFRLALADLDELLAVLQVLLVRLRDLRREL